MTSLKRTALLTALVLVSMFLVPQDGRAVKSACGTFRGAFRLECAPLRPDPESGITGLQELDGFHLERRGANTFWYCGYHLQGLRCTRHVFCITILCKIERQINMEAARWALSSN